MPVRRVLVVGVDGVRLDTLRRLPTPHLDALAADGFLTPVEVDDDTPTLSGPCWATIVTAVDVAKHGVWSNDLSGHRLDVFPDFATRLDRHDGRRTFVAAGWRPLLQPCDGGPLFRSPSSTVHIAPRAETPEAWEECDGRITEAAVRVLAEDDVAASFVYLGAPDETAHVLGCGEAYERAVCRADAWLGRLLAAVRSRPAYGDEEWTFLVVTDHGHADAGGHGGRTAAERTAWLVAAGPGIGPAAPRRIRHADVAAQVFAALGRHPDRHWTFDGRPFAARPHAVLFDLAGTESRSLTPDHLGDVVELLTLLGELEIPTALVSASSRPDADAVLKTLDTAGAPAFATTVAVGETSRTAPASAPYLAAARTLGADPAACLAVTGSTAGLTAAEAAGCRVLAVPASTPLAPAPRRTVRRGLTGLDAAELWAAGL
ncbi:alkaline phosphatase family protein [Streptomyces sp. MMG1121]|uniref:alkaline phosphatase family protein n=1 Tax=Streptomyces sp. MMG1121 TaxID=1415544 RepID=UPI0006AF73C3|nr:alkaline phosphatase family protein [Streptomyces sp. MMG1121]KOV63970.1 phosphodiesterase [Streptomyces sp. MMG1121]